MPRNPTAALGKIWSSPSSKPLPARRIETTAGSGSFKKVALISSNGVEIFFSYDFNSLVASTPKIIPASFIKALKITERVFLSLIKDNLCCNSGCLTSTTLFGAFNILKTHFC